MLDVIEQPYALSQRPLLREAEFMSAAGERGLAIGLPQLLEGLHRDGFIVPILKVDHPVRRMRARACRAPDGAARQELRGFVPTDGPNLRELASAGLLQLGRARPFQSWRLRERREAGAAFHASDFLYSLYQMLVIPQIHDALAWRNRGQPRGRPDEFAQHVADAARTASVANDARVALLTALEPHYYPSIVMNTRIPFQYGSFEQLQDAERAFDPVAFYRWLDWPREDLRALAEQLLVTARNRDPLRDWRELVALIHPDKWAELNGEALLAIDFRIAAEMILRFLEELASLGHVPSLPDLNVRAYHPLGDRLKPDLDRLDPVLLEYGISPHPALLLVLEGPTEMTVVPKVMRLMGIPVRDSYIKLVDLGGVTKQTELLARYIAPVLRRLDKESAHMLRPPTRVMVVVDAEGKYATVADRMARKDEWVTHILNALEPEFQTDVARRDIELLVDVQTWTDRAKDFEYAHFTPRTLARAILATGRAPASKTESVLVAEIAKRLADGKSLKGIWRGWPKPLPNKLQMWEYLWPILDRRIKRAHKSGTLDRIPVCRALLVAEGRASQIRRHVIMRVG